MITPLNHKSVTSLTKSVLENDENFGTCPMAFKALREGKLSEQTIGPPDSAPLFSAPNSRHLIGHPFPYRNIELSG